MDVVLVCLSVCVCVVLTGAGSSQCGLRSKVVRVFDACQLICVRA